MLTLNNLTKSTAKKRRRVGRGNASKGNYSGRGMKGQRSRSGGKKRLALKGIKSYLLRIPKKKGFGKIQPMYSEVTVGDLQRHFLEGNKVTPKKLKDKNLIKKSAVKVKLLGKGRLTKKLEVNLHKFTVSAEEAVVKAGGLAHIISPKKQVNQKK